MAIVSDEELLNIMVQDSSRSSRDLAKILPISDTAIRKRIRKLTDQGIIKRYTIEIDHRKLGYELTSFIGFDTEASAYTTILEEIKTWGEVKSIFQTSLDHDFLMECWFHDNDELTKFITRLENLPGVTRVCPATVIQRLK